jgi:two-component system response regulator FixJ
MHDAHGEFRREETIFVVDGSLESRAEAIAMLREAGFQVEGYRDCSEFLDRVGPAQAGCLLLDLASCRFSDLRLHERIASDQILLPVVAVTRAGDVSTAVAAMKAGAVDCLERPFQLDDLLEQVNRALAHDRERRYENVALSRILMRVERLTRREREVMELVVAGHPNKVIAQLLRISPRTVEVHRARVMEKMQASSVSELVRAAMIMNLGGSTAGSGGAAVHSSVQPARLTQ